MNLFHCQYELFALLLIGYYCFMIGYTLTAGVFRRIDLRVYRLPKQGVLGKFLS